MITRFLAAATVFGFLRSDASAQAIGSITLQLGQSREQVVNELQERYELRPLGERQFLVAQTGGPPFTIIGNIAFEDGRLSYVSRVWEPRGDASKEAAVNAAVNALSQLAGETCNIQEDRHAAPEVELNAVYVTCDQHSISIIVAQQETGASISISENWSSTPPSG